MQVFVFDILPGLDSEPRRLAVTGAMVSSTTISPSGDSE